MIKVNNLKKKFGNFWALKGISFCVPKGNLFAFLGPNGAGKTTTIKILVGLLKPTEGEIIINGKDAIKNREDIKKYLAYMPDEPYLYEKLTGREFLDFVANIYQIPPDKKNKIIDKFIPIFKLEDKLNNLIEDYSHGMRQKLIITATFLKYPEIILIDEPLVGLDPYSARQFKKMLKKFCDNGGTVFLSTHTLSVAEELADIIGVIKEGEIIFLGSISDLKKQVKKDANLEDLFLILTKERDEASVSL